MTGGKPCSLAHFASWVAMGVPSLPSPAKPSFSFLLGREDIPERQRASCGKRGRGEEGRVATFESLTAMIGLPRVGPTDKAVEAVRRTRSPESATGDAAAGRTRGRGVAKKKLRCENNGPVHRRPDTCPRLPRHAFLQLAPAAAWPDASAACLAAFACQSVAERRPRQLTARAAEKKATRTDVELGLQGFGIGLAPLLERRPSRLPLALVLLGLLLLRLFPGEVALVAAWGEARQPRCTPVRLPSTARLDLRAMMYT